MAATATATATVGLKIRIPAWVQSGTNVTNLTVPFGYKNSSPGIRLKYSSVRAQGGGNSSGSGDSGAGGFIAQEDVEFILKLVSGSIAGGGAIKYGSIIFPGITKPNIVVALAMIFTPVALALWLLIKQSSAEKQN